MIKIMDILYDHVIGSNPRSDIGVNNYVCVAAHLKYVLMR